MSDADEFAVNASREPFAGTGKIPDALVPVVIAQGRYHAGWFAIPNGWADENCDLHDGLWDDDTEAFEWVDANRHRVGIGWTPQDAYEDMMAKHLGGKDVG